NLIGWILLGEGLGLALLSLGNAYSVMGIATNPGALPGPRLIGTVAEWSFFPIATGLTFVFLFFPTGRLPSPRWRPIVAFGIATTALLLAAFIVTPRAVELPAPA